MWNKPRLDLDIIQLYNHWITFSFISQSRLLDLLWSFYNFKSIDITLFRTHEAQASRRTFRRAGLSHMIAPRSRLYRHSHVQGQLNQLPGKSSLLHFNKEKSGIRVWNQVLKKRQKESELHLPVQRLSEMSSSSSIFSGRNFKRRITWTNQKSCCYHGDRAEIKQ